jgi:selenocysteine lyase/cysteine desulfurase
MQLDALRAEFPVLERVAYLNAGTNGPVPRGSIAAAHMELRLQEERGRGDIAFFRDRALPLAEELRSRVAALMGCDADELALTGSTTDGVNTVVSALELGPGDEVLTSDEEHPGVLAPLAAGRARRGFEVRTVPFERLPAEVGPRTRLVACSHVSWMTGRVVDARLLAESAAPVLLDGAQGLGAVPVEVRALGCDFYAASGQKWLCGPNGVGYLYVRSDLVQRLLPPWPSFGSLREPHRPLDFELRDSARRFDGGFPPPHHCAWALAALGTLGEAGMDAVLERAADFAGRLAEALKGQGVEVAPRGRSPLVSFAAPEPQGTVERLAAERVVVRSVPEASWVRVSVGGWTSEQELERLVELIDARGATSGS